MKVMRSLVFSVIWSQLCKAAFPLSKTRPFDEKETLSCAELQMDNSAQPACTPETQDLVHAAWQWSSRK